MSEIQQLLREIQAFMSGTDRSYQPRLKAMYERYREQCVEVADQLAACRGMLDKGLGADARSANLRMNPTLVERFDILNIPERREFIALCEDYGLAPMPPWDEEMAEWLQSPVQEGDVKSASLMQQWRKIARKGSCSEKIRVLRQIVGMSGVYGGSWKRNLAEAEKQRYLEIESALPALAGEPDELARLEEFSLELYSPQLLTHPKEELLEALKERLLPLQRERHGKLLESILEEMQKCYARLDYVALRACCAEWEQNAGNPLAAPTAEQQQTVRDVMEFLSAHDREVAAQENYERLLLEVGQMLEKSTPWEELELKYGELQRTERPLPEALTMQMAALEEEHQMLEHRRHVRRCVYGVSLAVLLLALTGIAIVLLQRRNLRESAQADMAQLLADGRYEEGLALFEKLQKDSPEVARNPDIVAAHAKLQQEMAERDGRTRSAQAEFGQIQKTLAGMMTESLLESAELDKLLARADGIKADLTDEQRAQLVRLNASVSRAKEQIRKNRENVLGTALDDWARRLAELRRQIETDRHRGAVTQYQAALKELGEQLARELSESKVDVAIVNRRRALLSKELESVTAAVAAEDEYRGYEQRLARPVSAAAYLSALGDYPKMPQELQGKYAAAHGRLGQWSAEIDDAQLTGDFRQAVAVAEERLGKHGERSVFLAEYALVFRQTESKTLAAWTKDAQKKYDLYEMRFVDAQGESTYFYSEKPPELEYDKRFAGYFRNIIAEVEPSRNGKRRLAVFKYQQTARSFENSLNALRPEWRAPAVFARLDGWSEENPFIGKCRILPMLEPMAKAASPAALEMAAVELLESLATADINPAIKHDVALAVVKSLGAKDEYSRAALQPVSEILENIRLSGDWMEPGVGVASREELLRLKMLAHVDWVALNRQWQFQREFADTFRARRLCPVGVMTLEGGRLCVSYFVGNPTGELLVIENGSVRKLSSSAETGAVVQQDNGLLFNGQLVWGYADGRTCGEFLEYWRRRADTVHGSLKITTRLCPKEFGHYLK